MFHHVCVYVCCPMDVAHLKCLRCDYGSAYVSDIVALESSVCVEIDDRILGSTLHTCVFRRFVQLVYNNETQQHVELVTISTFRTRDGYIVKEQHGYRVRSSIHFASLQSNRHCAFNILCGGSPPRWNRWPSSCLGQAPHACSTYIRNAFRQSSR